MPVYNIVNQNTYIGSVKTLLFKLEQNRYSTEK